MTAIPTRKTTFLALCLASTAAPAVAQHEHGDFCDPETSVAEPVLGVGDFDGDGTVTESDVQALRDEIEQDRYAAFHDLNADGRLDEADVERARAEIGTESSEIDRQLASAFEETRAYRDIGAAIADGYGPGTQSFHGHGAHWFRHPSTGALDYGFDPGAPEGLNYDAQRNLWAVFYYVGESPRRQDGSRFPPGHDFRPMMEAPEGFAGAQDTWHFHAGACFEGLDYQNPTLNPEDLDFTEGLSPSECLPKTESGEFDTSSTKWTPKFYMLHAWIYELNPCGTFAGAHPRLAPQSPEPQDFRPQGKVDTFDPHEDFPFEGGTLCAWLTETDEAPAFCSQG